MTLAASALLSRALDLRARLDVANLLDAVHKPDAAAPLQTDKAIEVQADIPGVSKEDIKLDVEKDVLSLSVESKKEAKKQGEEQGVTWHHTERSHSFMRRSIRLPETADTDNVSAKYEAGVLKVTVPKREVPNKQKRIAVS